MSHIDDLIAEYCPQGVPFATVGEVFSTVTSKGAVKRSEYQSGGSLPIVDQGQALIAGYVDDESVAIDGGPFVVFGDHTRAIKWVDFRFAAGADGTKILESDERLHPRFGYYVLAGLSIPDRGYNRHWTVLRDMRIGIPPMEVQQAVVRILDAMTSLQAELQAELTARRTQYEYYRDSLLNFTTSGTSSVRWLTLGEVVRIRNGRDYKQLGVGGIPVYGSGGVMTTVDTAIYEKPSVLIPRKGSLSKLYFLDSPFWTVDTIFYTEINESLVLPKFVFYFLATRHLEELNEAGGVPSLTQNVLNRQPFPVPSLAEQERIVAILDKFDELTVGITTGLPAEIEARRKQYEYYRDKLLTFEELAA